MIKALRVLAEGFGMSLQPPLSDEILAFLTFATHHPGESVTRLLLRVLTNEVNFLLVPAPACSEFDTVPVAVDKGSDDFLGMLNMESLEWNLAGFRH
jgi:hypothetical protein